jgi:hypothetical protein
LITTQATPDGCGGGMATQLRLTCEGYKAFATLTDGRIEPPEVTTNWYRWHAYFTTRPGHHEDFRGLKPLMQASIRVPTVEDPCPPVETVVFGGILDSQDPFPEPVLPADCYPAPNGNGVYDPCDIAAARYPPCPEPGEELDCNDDRVPDDPCQASGRLYVDADAPPVATARLGAGPTTIFRMRCSPRTARATRPCVT